MRKSVFVIIAAIYFVSIIAIGYFGIRPSVFNEEILVDTVEFVGEDIIYDNSGGKVLRVTYEENLQIILSWRLEPGNATIKDVSLSIAANADKAEIDDRGVITFYSFFKSVKVTVTSDDALRRSDTITLLISRAS